MFSLPKVMTGIYFYDFTCLDASYEGENNKYPAAAVVAKINTSTTFSHPLRQIFLLLPSISINNRHSHQPVRHLSPEQKTGYKFLVVLVTMVMELIVVAMVKAIFM